MELRQSHKNLLIGVGLLISIFVVFGKSLGFPILFWDDQEHICRNPIFQMPFSQALLQAWLEPYFGMYVPASYNFWRFIGVFASGFGPECANWASTFHLANLILHFLNSILVCCLLNVWLPEKSQKWAWLGTFFFALHPLQVEPVAWISGARDLLSMSFGLGALLVFRKNLWVFATTLFALSMLSKPSGVVFPFLALLMVLRGMAAKTLVYAVAPPILMTVLIGAIAKFIQKDSALPFDLTLIERPLIYLQSVGFYLMKVVAPINLVPDYGRSVFALRADTTLYWPLAITGVVVTAAVWIRKIELNFAVEWILIALLPVSGLVAFGFQQYSTVADRYFLVSMVGVAFLFAYLLRHFESKDWVAWAAVVVISYLGAGSWIATKRWASDEVLFTHNARVVPHSRISNSNLANVQFVRGNFKEAEPIYRKALEINPQDSTAWISLAQTLEKLGRTNEAESLLHQAVQRNLASAEIYNNLAASYYGRKDFTRAEEYWKQAASLRRNYFEPRFNLGLLYWSASRFVEAETMLSQAVRIAPNNERARTMLDNVRSRLGR